MSFLGAKRALLAGSGDSLAALFAKYGASGFLFDKPDPSYRRNGLALQYKTRTGITAVDAASDPVGFMLDRSQGVAVGAEKISNGGFDSASSWTDTSTNAGSADISGGTLTVTNGGSTATDRGSREQLLTGMTVGASYVIEFDGLVVPASGVFLQVSTTSHAAQQLQVQMDATFQKTGNRCFFVAGSTSQLIGINAYTAGASGEFDNISVRKVSGNHARQATAAARPTLAGASPFYHSFDGGDYWETGLNPTTSMTLAACVRTAGAATQAAIGSFLSGNTRCMLRVSTGGQPNFSFADAALTDPTDYTDQDIVILGRGSPSDGVKLHVNGVQVDQTSFAGSVSTTKPLLIGARDSAGTPGQFWDGRGWSFFAMTGYASDADSLLIQRELSRGVLTI